MTPASEPPRKKSTLAGATVWSAPSVPPPGATPTAAPLGSPATESVDRTNAPTPAAPRGRARNLAEAQGRKRARDAAYAWASAEQRAGLRLQEFVAEMDAALQRGTAPETIAEYITEACARNGIDAGLLPPQIRAAAGLTD